MVTVTFGTVRVTIFQSLCSGSSGYLICNLTLQSTDHDDLGIMIYIATDTPGYLGIPTH